MAQILFTPTLAVEPRPAPPSDYQNIQTAPQQFGAGVAAGEEKLGAGLSTASHFFGEVAADQATNGWQDETTKILYGDPASGKPGYYALKGQAAMDEQPRVSAQIQQLRNQYRGQLGTAGQQLQFDQNTRRMQFYLLSEVGRHYDNQSNLWAAQVNKAADNNALQFVSQHADDEEQVKHGTADLMSSRLKQLQITAGTSPNPDLINSTLLDARRDAIQARVQALLPTNPSLAQQIMQDPDQGGLLRGPRLDALSNAARISGARIARQTAIDIANEAGSAIARAPGEGREVGPPAQGAVPPAVISQAAQKNGVDPALANATAHIESDHGANAGSPTQRYAGIFQLGPEERELVGGSAAGIGSLDEQVDQGTKLLGLRKTQLAEVLGREPTNAEVYLAHQQGVTGAWSLLTKPDTRAGDLVGNAAIRANGGDPDAPAGQFVSIWQSRYNAAAARFADTGVAAPIPNASTGVGTGTPARSPAAQAIAGSLQQRLDYIDQQVRSGRITAEDAEAYAIPHAERRWSAEVADENRIEAFDRGQRKQASDQAEAEYIKDAESGDPKLTAQSASADDRMTNEAKLRMIGFIDRVNKPDPIAKVSQQTTTRLLEDMRREPGDARRINDTGPIYDAFIHSQLNRADFDFLTKQFTDIRSPNGERLATQVKLFMDTHKPFITKSNLLMGQQDPIGDANFYNYNWTVERKIDQYRKEGKDPSDLLNPQNPDFIGSADFMRPFQSTFQQTAKEKSSLEPRMPPAFPGVALPAAGTPPGPVPRQPGESPADYLRRIGTPPPPAAAAEPAPAVVAPPIR